MSQLPVITLAPDPYRTVDEDGAANLVYTFFRTGPYDALTVNYTVGGTASLGSDYTGIDPIGAVKVVTFAPDASTATVVVAPTADTLYEFYETVELTLAPGPGYSIDTSGPVVGWIGNDDPFVNPAGLRRLEIWPGP